MTSRKVKVGPGWRQHPLLTENWLATRSAVPQLALHVYAIERFVTVYAITEWTDDEGKQRFHEIARHTWRSSVRPTESMVVEWGYKALGKWLAEHLPTE